MEWEINRGNIRQAHTNQNGLNGGKENISWSVEIRSALPLLLLAGLMGVLGVVRGC